MHCPEPAERSAFAAPHPFIRSTEAFIRKEQLVSSGCALLVGVSGGPDSIALLHALVALRTDLSVQRITVLHFNHRLRGEASDADQAFVTSLAAAMGLECFIDSADVRAVASAMGVSLEMASRFCRHRFFTQALAAGWGDRVALAHTANDQGEEALLRLFRGTGPSGMSGMAPKSARGIIRPLLFAWRRSILEFLQDGGHAFREDASNAEPWCRRNVLRLEVIPLIERHFHGRVLEAVVRHTELARDEECWWEAQLESLWTRVCVEHVNGRMALDGACLASLLPALQRRLVRRGIEKLQGHLQRITAAHVEAIRGLIIGPRGAAHVDLPGRLRAAREGSALILSLMEATEAENRLQPPLEATFESPGVYRLGEWEWSLRRIDAGALDCVKPPFDGMAGQALEVRMDADTVAWPLCVRAWLPGDRFAPLGLGGTKKLQDFFVDAKVERARRTRIPLLCDREKICWVVGLRIDERVRVTPLTRHVLVVCLRYRNPIPEDHAPGSPSP